MIRLWLCFKSRKLKQKAFIVKGERAFALRVCVCLCVCVVALTRERVAHARAFVALFCRKYVYYWR